VGDTQNWLFFMVTANAILGTSLRSAGNREQGTGNREQGTFLQKVGFTNAGQLFFQKSEP
jgi:hypothetical protein